MSKNITRTRPRCNATPSDTLCSKGHAWKSTLHTLHFISPHLIFSSHLSSSHRLSSSQLFSSQLTIAQPLWSHGSSSEFISAFVSTSQYYFVLQSSQKVLFSITLFLYVFVCFCTTKLAHRDFPLLLCTTSEFVWWMGNSDDCKQAVGVGHCGACMRNWLTRKVNLE